MSWFYRNFPRFFYKCTLIVPIFYRAFLTALIITHTVASHLVPKKSTQPTLANCCTPSKLLLTVHCHSRSSTLVSIENPWFPISDALWPNHHYPQWNYAFNALTVLWPSCLRGSLEFRGWISYPNLQGTEPLFCVRRVIFALAVLWQ